MEQMQVLAKETVFVGDHPINDVEGARNAGMVGVWKKDSQWKIVNADYIMEDLQDLIPIIKKGSKPK